uniref:Zinc finger CCHC domain-containing protein 17 n=1 Tax=Ursus americanus TaxID=9643 RepID=A0A452RV23_URSAM
MSACSILTVSFLLALWLFILALWLTKALSSNNGRPLTANFVAMVTDYGAFIKIPGCRKQGLVHRTHMSSCRVDKPSEIVDVGDKVWVKLIGREMKNDRIKVSLSMKVVNQGTGKDLDPNNVIIEQEERRRRSFQDYTGQKITLEAVLNTTCKKCGCKEGENLKQTPC